MGRPNEGELQCPPAESFSLTGGGPFDRLLVRLGQKGGGRDRVIRRAVFAVALTWLPLLTLSLAQGVAFGPRVEIAFLRDIAVNLRFLVALPILILAESRIDRRWRQLVLEFLRTRLVSPAELPAFAAVIDGVTRLRDRVLPEAVLAVVAFLPSLFVAWMELLSVSSWHSVGAGGSEVSLAGWWFNLVSTPVFRFLLLRWAWRMLLWTLFLWRVSRLGLQLVATHADRAAGLGFLSEGQRTFTPIVFAGGVVVAGQVGNAIAYEGATLSAVQSHMIAYGVLALLVLVAPLLAVAPVLVEVKKRALFEYGALLTNHAQSFDAKWIRGDRSPNEVILGSPDASSLADLGSSFTVVREMGVVPIDRRTLIVLALAAALPMLPVVIFATPANELIGAVIKMLG
ncbi:MAG TPA: hypothetical protein VMS64_08710 [Candidatus Methylomirabilis sp.]|nr:hypothetical protein [Candidatus Methylomirabilis sp.]